MRCFGLAKATKNGLQIMHPEVEMLYKNEPMPSHLTPIYPASLGLSQKWLRKTIALLLEEHAKEWHDKQDSFANALSALQPMLNWMDALKTIHHPAPSIDQEMFIRREHLAHHRLIVEELLAQHLSLQRVRQQAKARQGISFILPESAYDAFVKQLPFSLTLAQKRAFEDIKSDLASSVPMLRLVQGDVGCGKTIVAALAALAVMVHKAQVALMAPTEILAEQHYHHFCEWFSRLGYRCELLTSKLNSKAKREIVENITLGLINIVIGTHALFQEEVQFKILGLVIIDEQHRFGVSQRLALQSKGEKARNINQPHQLVLTATPIPRTLAMSHYSHVDISVIDALPPGREVVSTLALANSRRSEIIERMQVIIANGQQVYWVCTLIEGSDSLACQAAQQTAEELQKIFPNQIGLVHGKMQTGEKERVMLAFYKGEISVLVATTVIEVGVNVPNATLMVIENAERLGLAQLHQLRGRVGRSVNKSYCILLYSSPLSEIARERLKIIRQTNDGFQIAEADLALRGPGEILGVRQTGALSYKIADLERDKEMIKKVPLFSKSVSGLSEEYIESMLQRWGMAGKFECC